MSVNTRIFFQKQKADEILSEAQALAEDPLLAREVKQILGKKSSGELFDLIQGNIEFIRMSIEQAASSHE